MKYTKKEVGEELKKELQKGYNIRRIAIWADDLCLRLRDNSYSELRDILSRIDLMRAGPEFEFTEFEIYLLSLFLIKNESDPLQKIIEMRSNDSLKNKLCEKILEENYIEISNRQLPSFSGDDRLFVWLIRLIEMSEFFTKILSSVILNKKNYKQDIPDIRDLEKDLEKLFNFSDDDKLLKEYKAYFDFLNTIRTNLLYLKLDD